MQLSLVEFVVVALQPCKHGPTNVIDVHSSPMPKRFYICAKTPPINVYKKTPAIKAICRSLLHLHPNKIPTLHMSCKPATTLTTHVLTFSHSSLLRSSLRSKRSYTLAATALTSSPSSFLPSYLL
jgi:hypothetical protein